MVVFCRCKCYFSQNIYIKSLQGHVCSDLIEDVEELRKLESKYGASTVEKIKAEIRDEINTRNNFVKSLPAIRHQIEKEYKPTQSEVYVFKEEYLTLEFIGAVDFAQFLNDYCLSSDFKLYQFPLFSEKFCSIFLEEMKHFTSSDLPNPRPNTMNSYGVLLDLMGFAPFIEKLRKLIEPLAKIAFPEWSGDGLDSHRAFTVSYAQDKDVDLGYHYDNAEVTLNISLLNRVNKIGECRVTNSASSGDLYFGSMYDESPSSMQCIAVKHKPGWAILHRGRQLHGALPIYEGGERENLIIWMRASSVRNNRCPMCHQLPELITADDGDFGDGFTCPTVNVCCLL